MIHLIVFIIFFIVWSHLAIEVLVLFPEFLFWIIGFSLPITLLVAILQFKNLNAYTSVILIFIFSTFVSLRLLFYYLKELWQEFNGKIATCSCCPKCETQNLLLIIIISLLAISLMYSSKMVKYYKLKSISFNTVLNRIIFSLLTFLIIISLIT